MIKLDSRKTSLSSGLIRTDPEDLLSDGGVAMATPTAEKELMDGSGEPGTAGILRKSSKRLYITFCLIATMIVSSVGAVSPAYAACPSGAVFGIPPWYRGLQLPAPDCGVKGPGSASGDLSKYIWTIALNVIQAALTVVGYISLFYIIKGGFKYITSAGSTEGMASAKSTITNAIIGTIIAVLSASIVNAVAGIIK